MKLRHLLISALTGMTIFAATVTALADDTPVTQWTIDGQTREAIILAPKKKSSALAPVIFSFHGHGGTMRFGLRYDFQKYWPEAMVVYPQGLLTKTPNDPQGKRPGWQLRKGDYSDRDLQFFDAMLKTLCEKYNVDNRRIYVTGHSNGGAFTYLLWAERGSELAAIAPSSAPALIFLGDTSKIKALPVLHLAGEKDPIVPYANQVRSMEYDRKALGCLPEGKPWANADDIVGTIYPSPGGTPFVSLIHPGGHRYPQAAISLIVRFFKEHS
jgi:polyhydroxybutyrate depolymerase